MKMAKWGEGDPRWLVEERPDAINVNNWHWTEKNASPWSINKLCELFTGVKMENELYECKIIDVKCSGDAVVNNRKGKLIFIYDWLIELKCKCYIKSSTINGNININFCEEGIEDINFDVTFDTTGYDVDVAKHAVQTIGEKIIQEKLSMYVSALEKEFSKDIILPVVQQSCNPSIKISPAVKSLSNNVSPSKNFIVTKSNMDTEDLYCVEVFKCTAEDFYIVFTSREMVKAFTQDNCICFDPCLGGYFKLFDGNVEGFFKELKPFEIIAMKWRLATWPPGHYSDVLLTIRENTYSAEVTHEQFGIPMGEIENTRQGWKKYYWDSIKRIFGFGTFLS